MRPVELMAEKLKVARGYGSWQHRPMLPLEGQRGFKAVQRVPPLYPSELSSGNSRLLYWPTKSRLPPRIHLQLGEEEKQALETTRLEWAPPQSYRCLTQDGES